MVPLERVSAAELAAYAGAVQYVLLADRDDGTVVRCGDVVAKAHAGDSDPDALAVRIRVAGDPALAGVLLPPLRTGLGLVGSRPVSLWPYGAPVAPDRPEEAPWEQVAELLAALHRTPLHHLPYPVPPMRGPAKLARALRRLDAAHPPEGPVLVGHAAPGRPAGRQAGDPGGARRVSPAGERTPDHGRDPDRGSGDGPPRAGAAPALPAGPPSGRADRARRAVLSIPNGQAVPAGQAGTDADAAELARLVRAAAATLPGWARGEGPPPSGGALCHGDLHLGQLVRSPAGGWRLIDVDDLGLGAPAWDLARPAAWYAAGLLDTGTWLRFLDAYRAAGGPAAGAPGSDPWPELDLAARALTVQTAALALAKAARERRRLDDVERLMVEACARIASLPPDLEPEPPS
ncbi:phosphotransferase [Streptomyces sp. NBC_01264]|uniref:phosphotransferase n=1 Tax=Streptomyces sp. NBC_01264 TaxID=2903804 RepID=UPI0022595CAA|nr:phosphotransferase [Streptomyces sp. NBC_01264]MCX4777224.1 phosphotransferase [Streptomyces sp. NBC_01264]